MKTPKVVAEISSENLHSLLICISDDIANYYKKDERELTLDDALEYLESRKGQVFLVREW